MKKKTNLETSKALSTKFSKKSVFYIVVAAGLLVLTVIAAILLFSRDPEQYLTSTVAAVPSGKPVQAVLSDFSGGQVTISWISEQSGNGSVYIDDQRYVDDRGEDFQGFVHTVTLRGLTSETTYHVEICGNNVCAARDDYRYGIDKVLMKTVNPLRIEGSNIVKAGKPILVETPVSLSIADRPGILTYGRIQSSQLPTLPFCIVLVNVVNKSLNISSPLVSVTTPDGGWGFDMSNARSENLGDFFLIDSASDSLQYTLICPGNSDVVETRAIADVENTELLLDL